MKRGERQPTTRANRAQNVSSSTRQFWFVPVLLFLFTLALYWPSYHNGYLWDDDLLTQSDLVRGDWSGLRDLWSSTKYPDFIPITATTYWIEWKLGCGNPIVQHTTNIVLQSVNVVFIWLILRHLKIKGAAIAAALFASHPLCVTSVTWIAERKNTLSMLFYLLSLLFFLHSQENSGKCEREKAIKAEAGRTRTYYALSLATFILALLSKTSTVVLPVVFLLCAWWRDGRISRAMIRATSPYFIFALAAGITILIANYVFGAKNLPSEHLLPRLLGGARAVWFYFGKTFLPVNLTMNYPRWEIDPASIISYLPVIAIVVVFTVCWRFRESWGRACLFGLGYYIIALGPTLGVFKMTFLAYAQVADHFQFLALPGLIALVVGGVFYLLQNTSAATHHIARTLLLAVVSLLSWQSWQHQHVLRNRETLWTDNIQKNSKSWLARYDLGSLFQARGQLSEAERLYREAIELRPDYLAALSNLGGVLGREKRWSEATDCYRRALNIDPNAAKIHFNLGNALMAQNQFGEAAAAFSRAVDLDPRDSSFHNNLANALMKIGKPDEAVQHAREAVRLDSSNNEAQANLGLILFQTGKIIDAVDQFEGALKLNPENLLAHSRFAMLLATQHKDDEALQHLSMIVRLQPDNILAHTGMADILARQGKPNEAMVHQIALKFLHGQEALNKGQVDEAKDDFRQALKLDGAATIAFARRICSPSTPNALSQLDLLAALCREAGQIANTTNVLEKIISMAQISGQKEVFEKYRGYLEAYRQSIARP